MIGNLKLQPNYGLDADNNHKTIHTSSSTVTTVVNAPKVNAMMNHHFSDSQQEKDNSVRDKLEIIANIHNYSQPLSKQLYNPIQKHEYDSEENDDDDDEEEEEDGHDDMIEEDDGGIEENDNNQIKPNNSLLNSSNPEVDDNTPEHHTRRPMNAFLMFCKRHRSIVKEKFPNLENRAITKILGDWWANIDKEEKVAYTNLAKEYKDAFFSAHPNFKWYKLPAPPLRTLSTRPGTYDRTSTSISEDDHDYVESVQKYTFNIHVKHEPEYEIDDTDDNIETEMKSDYEECTKPIINNFNLSNSNTNLNSIENNLSFNDINLNNFNNNNNNVSEMNEIMKDCKKILQPPSTVSVFKLADEKEMGGLNSLMQLDNQNGTRDEGNAKTTAPNEANYSQDGLQKYSEPFTNMRDHAHKMQEDSKISKTNISNNLKRKINNTATIISSSAIATVTGGGDPSLNGVVMFDGMVETMTPTKIKKRNNNVFFHNNNNDMAINNNNNETIITEYTLKKSSRACKGKRYKEFMINSGKFSNTPNSHLQHHHPNQHHLNSRNNRKLAAGGKVTNKTAVNGGVVGAVGTPMLVRGDTQSQDMGTTDMDNMSMVYDGNSPTSKACATAEFDLEKRINALPSLNLDLFMVRKRETKKTKKLSKRGKPSKTHHNSESITNEAQERSHPNKVGSQKRKARKESITRLDIVPNKNDIDPLAIPSSSVIANSLVDNNDENVIGGTSDETQSSGQPAASNLFILATLAEEEANKTKMQIT